MKSFYDGQNASLTLGFLVLEHAKMQMDLLLRDNSLDKIQSYEMFLDWLDGQLAGYRSQMKLSFFDKETEKMVEFDGYELAICEIFKKLKEKEGAKNDKIERTDYVYWLNRRAELIASCYEHVRLMPERRSAEDQWEEETEQNDNSLPPETNTEELPETWIPDELAPIEVGDSNGPNPNNT